MNRRTLGRTGLEVSELALGGLFVSSYGGASADRARDTVHLAVNRGVNYIDTAPSYGNSEELLGPALNDVQEPVILSTKLGGRPQPFEPKDKDALRRSVEESLRLLGRDRIDILMIHEPDRPAQFDWWNDRERYYGPVIDLLEELKTEGVIRFTGLGGTTAYEMVPIVETGRFDVLLTAFNYSLLFREAESYLLPAAMRLNMGIVIGSPLQQGALSTRWSDDALSASWLSPPRRAQFQALYKLADEAGMGVPEMALRFVISNSHISCVLTGARSAKEAQDNINAIEKGSLPDDMLTKLDEIAARVPFRPYEEPAILPFGRGYRGPGALH
jgi:aryl-alcohol dehydrogenase-like predicted oxidoreductase